MPMNTHHCRRDRKQKDYWRNSISTGREYDNQIKKSPKLQQLANIYIYIYKFSNTFQWKEERITADSAGGCEIWSWPRPCAEAWRTLLLITPLRWSPKLFFVVWLLRKVWGGGFRWEGRERLAMVSAGEGTEGFQSKRKAMAGEGLVMAMAIAIIVIISDCSVSLCLFLSFFCLSVFSVFFSVSEFLCFFLCGLTVNWFVRTKQEKKKKNKISLIYHFTPPRLFRSVDLPSWRYRIPSSSIVPFILWLLNYPCCLSPSISIVGQTHVLFNVLIESGVMLFECRLAPSSS